jgi:hypothetical protein
MSLVGLLMMVLIIGILGAGGMLGLSSLTGPTSDKSLSNALGDGAAASADSGGWSTLGASSKRACRAAAEAARSAAALYFTDAGGRVYPTTWSDLTASALPYYSLAPNVVINEANPKELDSSAGWKLAMSSGGSRPTTFACS